MNDPENTTTRRLLSGRQVTRTLAFAGAILVGALAGVFLAYESDLPQVSSLENYRPTVWGIYKPELIQFRPE